MALLQYIRLYYLYLIPADNCTCTIFIIYLFDFMLLNVFIEILLKAIWLSVDPYMRAFGNRMNVGDTILGSQVAQ